MQKDTDFKIRLKQLLEAMLKDAGFVFYANSGGLKHNNNSELLEGQIANKNGEVLFMQIDPSNPDFVFMKDENGNEFLTPADKQNLALASSLTPDQRKVLAKNKVISKVDEKFPKGETFERSEEFEEFEDEPVYFPQYSRSKIKQVKQNLRLSPSLNTGMKIQENTESDTAPILGNYTEEDLKKKKQEQMLQQYNGGQNNETQKKQEEQRGQKISIGKKSGILKGGLIAVGGTVLATLGGAAAVAIHSATIIK